MTPVTLSFLSVLEDLLADILNDYLLPVLIIAFDFFWDLITGLIRAALSHLLFRIFVLVLKVLLIIERIFDIFSCTVGIYTMQNGQMTPTSGYVDVTQNYSLIDVLMQSDPVTNAMLGMTAGAFVLCFIITIFSVIRSMGEGIGELKRPVSHVLRQTTKACVTFLLIPVVCTFVVRLAGVTITSISVYMPNNIYGGSQKQAASLVSEALSNNTDKPKRGTKQSSIEKAIAAKKSASATSDTRACDLIYYLTVKDALRNPDNEEYYLSGQHFQNTEAAFEDVDATRIDWIYAYFEVLLVIIIFLRLIIECMTRVFMILILFVVSPYFVAMMPLDDGAKFKKWKEMFVGFTISVFGPILAMKTYLVLLPYVVTGDALDLGFAAGNIGTWKAAVDNTMTSILPGTPEYEAVSFTTTVFRLFFIAAGGYAVYKSQNLMLDIINPEVSKFLTASSSAVGSLIGGAAGKGQKAAVSAIKKIGKSGDKGGDSEGGGDGS